MQLIRSFMTALGNSYRFLETSAELSSLGLQLKCILGEINYIKALNSCFSVYGGQLCAHVQFDMGTFESCLLSPSVKVALYHSQC